MTDSDLRLATFAVSLFTVGAVVLTRWTGDLFPWLSIFAFSSALVLLVLCLDDRRLRGDRLIAVLILVIWVSIAYRLIAFAHPASLVGMDPDRFAAWAHLTRSLGRAAVAEEFYSNAPAYHVMLATWSMIIDQTAIDTTGVFPVALGLATVLVVAAFGRLLTDSPLTVVVAALLGAVLATDVRLAYWPIAQAIGNVYLFLFIYLALTTVGTERKPRAVFLALFAIAMTLVHKLPIAVGLAIFVPLWVLYQFGLFSILAGRARVDSVDREQIRTRARTYLVLSVVLAVLLVYQWVLLTDFQGDALRLITSALQLDASVPILSAILTGTSGSSISPAGGAVPDYGIFTLFQLGSSQVIVMLFLGGIAWLYVVLTERQNPRWFDLLIWTTIVTAMVLGASASGFAVSHERMFWIASIPVIVLVAHTAIGVAGRVGSRGHTAISIFLVLLVFFQSFSAAALPAYPGTPRYYLDQNEVATKEWGHRHVPGEIRTDGYLAHEIVNLSRLTGVDDPAIFGSPGAKYRRYDFYLFQRNLTEQGYRNVLYRRDVGVYRLFGVETRFSYTIYRLTYDPESELVAQYDRVYSTGDIVMYRRPTPAPNATSIGTGGRDPATETEIRRRPRRLPGVT